MVIPISWKEWGMYAEFNTPWVKGLKIKTLWGGDFTSNEGFTYLDRTTDQEVIDGW
jgi:hypothetical protein